MPKLVCLLAAALMLVGGAANAHSSYPQECCHDKEQSFARHARSAPPFNELWRLP
jgi:hypothetical protein